MTERLRGQEGGRSADPADGWLGIEPIYVCRAQIRAAGVEAHILEAMKTEFLQRKIARKNIRKIAEDHKLFVTITTDGKTDGYGLKYGPRDGFPVELALVHDHYIHNFKTDIWRNARRSRLRRDRLTQCPGGYSR